MTDTQINPKEMLLHAVECDHAGRTLEALHLYQDGIRTLKTQIINATPAVQWRIYNGRIGKYNNRIAQIQRRMQPRNVIAYVSIDEHAKGKSYHALFGDYLNADVQEVLLEEPHLAGNHHFRNLITFLELLVMKCRNLKNVRLVTKTDRNATENQRTVLEHVTADLAERNVRLSIEFFKPQCGRKIFLSNGYTIKIGLGLHIYRPHHPLYTLGLCDYDFRKCLRTEMQISCTTIIMFRSLTTFVDSDNAEKAKAQPSLPI